MPEKIAQLARSATLRQLQVFECIANHQSFSKAAEQLHLTQPTVSMQVKKLTDILETPLFEQIGRKVYLTEAGKILYQASSNILAELGKVEQQINHLKGFSGGTVKMSVISTAQYFVPKVIHKFTQEHPDVTVLMHVGNKEVLLERFNNNQDDFYILGQPPEDLNVNSSRIAVNPLAFVANSQHPLVGKKLRIQNLTEEVLLMREKGSGIRSQIDNVFKQFEFQPKVKMVLGGLEAIRLGLIQNIGITVASVPTLMKEIEAGEISILNVKGFPINRHWYLIYPKGKDISMVSQKMIDLIKEEGMVMSDKAFSLFP